MAIGVVMALALRAVLAGAELGGHLTGSQLMLSYGSVVDPQGGVRSNLVANLYGNLALVTFLLVNGHHALLRALAASYTAIPIGGGSIGPSLAGTIVQLLGIVFVLGARLAAPIVVVMLLVEVGTAIMARVAPSLNLLAVAPPIRVGVGLLAMAAMVPLVPSVVRAAASGVGELALRAAGAFR
jgi:flagellar biosynthetic protein FliR